MITLIALIQTVLAVMQWELLFRQIEFEEQYPPEVLAAAHYHRWTSLFLPVLMTASAAFAWGLAFLKVWLYERKMARAQSGIDPL